MITVLVIVFISLAASFICSLFEAALYSITPSRVEELRRKGAPGAAKLAALRRRVDEPIAAILSFNTVAHTMGAVWAGGLVEYLYGDFWLTWFSIAFTLAVLFLTEIVPKTLGVVHASWLGPVVAWPIQVMIWGIWPLARLSLAVTERMTRRVKPGGPSEDEIIVMADLATQAGKLLPDEHVWVKNALRLNNVRTGDLMTPRDAVETVRAETTLAEIEALPQPLGHTRLPVLEGGDSLDHLVGLVNRRDIYDGIALGETEKKVRDLMGPITYVLDTLPANQTLNRLIRERRQLVAVLNEHGEVRGIVTLEDILENLLGQEIMDEYDAEAERRDQERRREAARRRAALRPPPPSSPGAPPR